MEQLSLFDQAGDLGAPLASRLRPQSLDEFVGRSICSARGGRCASLVEENKILP